MSDESVYTEEEIASQARMEAQEAKDRLELETQRADGAKRILDDPLVQEAFGNLEEVYMHALRYSPVNRPELREAARWRLEALSHFKSELQHVLDTGNMNVQRRQQEDELGDWLAEERRENG